MHKFLALACILFLSVAATDIPRHYPRSYSNLIEAARRERVVTVRSTTELHEVSGLLEAFRQAYPFLRVDYHEVGSRDLYRSIVSATQQGQATPDLAWSSSMDLQIKLVNDGYVQAYASPEKPYLPAWAIWKNEAYGVTAEPIVFVYNRNVLAPANVPRSHQDLLRLLRADSGRYRNRISTFDPARSGSGYLMLTQDYEANREIWDLVSAMGKAGVHLYDSSSPLLSQLAAGKQALAYNVLGSYAFELASRNPAIRVVIPSDYALVVSRIAVIPNEARHPAGAKLFLDFMLSRHGQFALSKAYMGPVRNDVPTHRGTKASASTAHPVRLGPTLLTNLDQIKRRRFLARWQTAMGGR